MLPQPQPKSKLFFAPFRLKCREHPHGLTLPCRQNILYKKRDTEIPTNDRRASRSGYALLAANDDWDDTPALLTHVPRQKHAPDAVYTLVGGHTIPEIGETCGYLYTACKYEIGTLDRAWAGGTNDRNVSVAGTGVMAFKAIPWEGMVLEPDDIPLLILRRAETARGAVELIGAPVGARYLPERGDVFHRRPVRGMGAGDHAGRPLGRGACAGQRGVGARERLRHARR